MSIVAIITLLLLLVSYAFLNVSNKAAQTGRARLKRVCRFLFAVCLGVSIAGLSWLIKQ